jgi:alpha-tubulin suppressor-like RCC1 family protein
MNFPKSMPFNVFRNAAAALAALLVACSSDPGTGTPIPARLGMSLEPPQTAQAGLVFAPQPVVQVLDVDGEPLAATGILVTATIASGGGTIGGTVGVRTAADGRAVFTDLVLGGALGPRTIRFSASGLSAVISRQVDLTAGPAAIAVITAGNSQTTAAGTAVPVAPSVKVTDGSDNPVAGVRVTFAVTGGGGTVTGPQPLTNVQGIATVGQWTLGTTIGQNALTATVDGIATPLAFQATATVGVAAQLTLVDGDGQNATIGTPVPVSPSVKITDAFGNVVTGLSVTFVIGSGGGTVTGGAPVSDANGVARVGAWRLGFVPGVNTITATRPGIPPVTFTANSTDYSIMSIASGVAHACGIGVDNVTRCWGDNSTGQFGNGTIQPDSVPVRVSGALVFSQVVSGDGHSCGLAAGGQAWCWGNNTNGELGDGTTISSNSPVLVAGGMNFTQLSSSGIHVCALDTTGAAWCWGNGNNGRLGDGLLLSRVTPTSVAGGHVFTKISAGATHTCALRNDNTVFCWGNNANGRLGDGTLVQRVVPTPVIGGTSFTTVSAGGSYTCAIDAAAAAWCWGSNASGQLGDGTNTQRTVPTAVTGLQTFTTITTGTQHTCGITSLFVAYCWGENASGRLGDGTGTDRNTPTLVSGSLSYASITAGDQHTCSRSTSGSAVCWGNNIFGQLGDGSQTGKSTPVGVVRTP